MPELRSWLRAVFVATAIVVLVPTVPIVASAFLPDAPILRNLSRLIVPYLPGVLGLAVLSAAASLIALRLGGQRLAKAVSAVSIATLLAVNFMTFQVVSFSLNSGAPISVTRLLGLDARAAPTADDVVTFARVDGTSLQAQIWRSPGPGAVALYIHGGSFTGGGIGERPWLFRSMADQGITIMDAEYRLAPPARWDTAPGDVLCALGWLEAHATELNGDAGFVVVVGDSAGGNLALMAAYAAGTDAVASSCPIQARPPLAVVAIEPAADLTGIWEDGTVPGGDGQRFPEPYVGGSPAQYPDRYAAASPLTLIRKGVPPTLLVAAEIDHLIRPARTAELAHLLDEAHVYCRIVTVPYAEHGIAAGPDDYGAQVLESFVREFATSVRGSGTPYGLPCD